MIDDERGRTFAAASTNEADERAAGAGGSVAAANRVGGSSPSAPRPPASNVVFDRGGFAYHGRVAAVADAAREAGLEF